jgi:hypothetical protein
MMVIGSSALRGRTGLRSTERICGPIEIGFAFAAPGVTEVKYANAVSELSPTSGEVTPKEIPGTCGG